MIKYSLRPKVSSLSDPSSGSASSNSSSSFPRALADSPPLARPNAIADAELDAPEDGLDPTLPRNTAKGAPGHQIKETPSEDEDDEGRDLTELLAKAGAQEAERDTVRKATR
jgi:hypothetical protein